MAGFEKPWMVVTIGAADNAEKVSGSQSRLLCTRSNSPDLLRQCATCKASHTLPSMVGFSPYETGQTASSSADVTESAVANKVTSMPSATSPSVIRLVTCSHGP